MYITYKMFSDGANSNLKFQYSVDGRSDIKYDFADNSTYKDKHGEEVGYTISGGFKTTNNIFRTIELRPSDKTEAKKFNSLQLHLNNPGGVVLKRNFNIDDITLIYRKHTVK